MTHANDCSAVSPCEACSKMVYNAKEALHEYNKALEILDELGAMPWILKDVHNTTDNFWRIYEDLRGLRDEADRMIPRNY